MFRADEALQQHLRDLPAHVVASDCTGCGKAFGSEEALQQHMRDSPMHTTTFDCTDCDKPLGTEEAPQQHLRDSPVRATTFDCTDCNKAFGTEEALQQHLQSLPAHVKTFDCTGCSKAFSTKKALQQHLQDPSLHAATFDCTDCNKIFGTQGALQQHLQSSPAHIATVDGTRRRNISDNKQVFQQCLSRKAKSGNPWSMYPSLHHNVSCLLEASNLSFQFHEADEFDQTIAEHDSSVMGRFACNNGACPSNGWSSKKIAITIRMYPGTQYNARVYNQRCQSCGRLGRQTLNDTYAERVAYSLKIWCGIPMDRPKYYRKSKAPHQSDLCEGCKDGHCSELV